MGSRNFDSWLVMELTLDRLSDLFGPFQIVSGGAEGPDAYGEEWSRARSDYPIFHEEPTIHKPEWYVNGTYFKGAGLRRNSLIVEEADVVVAFWDNASRGTYDSMKKAYAMGKPLMVVLEDGRMEVL